MSGTVVERGDPTYDEVRKIWNGMFDKKPGIIARCSQVSDVVAAVNFAKENNITIAVKGGGHNSAGTGSCDDGLMIDLSPLKKITIDQGNKTARVQGGCLWGEVDAALQQFGLAVPSGIIFTHRGRRPNPGRWLRMDQQKIWIND